MTAPPTPSRPRKPPLPPPKPWPSPRTSPAKPPKPKSASRKKRPSRPPPSRKPSLRRNPKPAGTESATSSDGTSPRATTTRWTDAAASRRSSGASVVSVPSLHGAPRGLSLWLYGRKPAWAVHAPTMLAPEGAPGTAPTSPFLPHGRPLCPSPRPKSTTQPHAFRYRRAITLGAPSGTPPTHPGTQPSPPCKAGAWVPPEAPSGASTSRGKTQHHPSARKATGGTRATASYTEAEPQAPLSKPPPDTQTGRPPSGLSPCPRLIYP